MLQGNMLQGNISPWLFRAKAVMKLSYKYKFELNLSWLCPVEPRKSKWCIGSPSASSLAKSYEAQYEDDKTNLFYNNFSEEIKSCCNNHTHLRAYMITLIKNKKISDTFPYEHFLKHQMQNLIMLSFKNSRNNLTANVCYVFLLKTILSLGSKYFSVNQKENKHASATSLMDLITLSREYIAHSQPLQAMLNAFESLITEVVGLNSPWATEPSMKNNSQNPMRQITSA